jgi:hypothetical protein
MRSRNCEARWRITVALETQYALHVCLCVCVRVCVLVDARGREHVCACSLAYPEFNAYAPYFEVIFGPSGSTIFFDIIS